MSDWLNVREAAQYLGLHPHTVKRWCADGSGPRHYRFGLRGDMRFRTADLEEWLSEHRTPRAEEERPGVPSQLRAPVDGGAGDLGQGDRVAGAR